MGAEAEYLKEDDNIIDDATETTAAQITLNPSQSKTDVMQISLGLLFDIE